ncbi:MAG TPA: helix-turn-helix domain-containing protein [Patescibacteria group bacterium]|nr:helix-turn-helix domain-containing protein [Patescibacteria group bacterium]
MRPAFYDSSVYREKQSSLTKKNWQKGAYNHLKEEVERTCARRRCEETFLVVASDPKKYCSQSCAAKVNNLKRSPESPVSKVRLEKLYKNGLSANEIAEKLGISLYKVNYWLKNFQIPKRSVSEAIYLKYNPNGDPFEIKEKLSPEERQLLGMGLGIYWGEGNK